MGSAGATDFYARLDKPPWAPPVWLFGPAWTVLYAMIALAAARVARTEHPWRRTALAAWWVQLVLNVGWTWCFFVLQNGPLAVAEAALLWAAAATAAVLAWRVDRAAGALLVPYVLWVGYATALTWAITARTPWL
ncbi:MAG: tryptophan-rich sensory protein [Gemmatimonadaceae bacterium]|nr:tryptophan-rich sensory protein [Gemmatimonadaceae bacterium]